MTAMFWINQLIHLVLHLGLLFVIYVGVMEAMSWRHRPLRMEPRRIAGESVRVIEGQNKGLIFDIQLEFEVPAGIQFTLRREGWFDRLAKAIGLISEIQLGEAKLDRALYLELPGSLLELHRTEPAALTWILGLDKRLSVQGARLLSPQARQGRLKLRALIVPARRNVEAVILSCVQWLETPLAALRQLNSAGHTESAWPTFSRWLGWAYFGTFAGGLALLHFAHAHIIDFGRLALHALILATLLTVAGFTWLSLRHDLRSTRHRLLLATIFLAWPTLWAASALLLRQINVSLDIHPPTVTALADSSLVTFPRRKVQHGVGVRYETLGDKPRLYEVGLFQALIWRARHGTQTGSHLQIQEHQGALGIAWRQMAEREDGEVP